MRIFFIITSILFGIALLLFLIYNFAFKDNPFQASVPGTAVVQQDGSANTGNASSASEDAISAFSDEEALSPFMDGNDRAILYLAPNARELKEKFIDTDIKRTLDTFSFVPTKALWSPDGSRALIGKNDTEWILYTRSTKEQIPLKSGIESPAWTTLGDRIVYKYFDPKSNTRTLTIANPDGSNWSIIGETSFRYLSLVGVPKSSLVALWNRGNAFEKTSLKTLPISGGDPVNVFSENYGSDYLFSPDGLRILESGTREKGSSAIMLALLNNTGGNYRNLNIPTFVMKAVWSKNNRIVYYSLPGSIPSGSALPNDYFEKKLLTSDTFWQVDTETGETKRLVDPSDITESYDAMNLVLSPDEDQLFFINRRDGKLYRIRL